MAERAGRKPPPGELTKNWTDPSSGIMYPLLRGSERYFYDRERLEELREQLQRQKGDAISEKPKPPHDPQKCISCKMERGG